MMTLWQMSLSGGFLILATVLLRKFTLDRLPKKTFLILWKITILRLLLPFSIPSLFSAWSLILQGRDRLSSHAGTPTGIFPPVILYEPSPAAARTFSEAAAASLPHPVRAGMLDSLSKVLDGQTKEELREEALLNEHIRQTIDSLVSRWSTDGLKITVDYTCMPLSDSFEPEKTKSFSAKAADTPHQESGVPVSESEEQREYPNATEEDYRALLALKTLDYPDISVHDFDTALLEWGNADDAGRLDRILCDIQWKDCQVSLTLEEQAFVQTSVYFSFLENARYIQSQYTGRPEENPGTAEYLPVKQIEENGMAAFCDLYYLFFWHITDRDQLTVRERDQAVNGLRTAVRTYWADTDLEQLLTMTKEDLTAVLDRFAREYSTDQITLLIEKDQISFESMDERGLAFP